MKGGALLENHDWESQIGVIEKVWVEKNERAWCRARFSKNPHPEEVWRDVVDEVKRNVSVGYIIDEYEMVENEDEEAELSDTILVTRWQPHEISIVSVPADVSVGLGREQDENGQLYAVRMRAGNQSTSRKRQSRLMATRQAQNNDPAPQSTNGEPPPETEINVEVVREQTRKEETKRVREMLAMGARFGCQAEAQRYIDESKSLDEFRAWVLENRFNAKPVLPLTEIGMSQQEVQGYSLVKAIRELSDIQAGPRLTGLEKEASDTMAKILKRQPQGFFLPPEIVRARPLQSRVVSVTPTPGGPGTIAPAPQIVAAELLLPMIELLRNRLVVASAGATMLPGLQGNIAFPKQTAGADAFWLAETAQVQEQNQTFDQVPLIPRRLSTHTQYTRQLVAQSIIDIEAVIRADLMAAMATTLDRTALYGNPVAPTINSPRGILFQPGINRFDFGTTEPLFEGYIKAVVSIDEERVPLTSMAWIVNPRTWGAAVGTPKFPNTGITILEPGNTVLGYPFITTQQIPATLPGTPDPDDPAGKVFFGSWSQLLIGQWEGLDIIVDPYTLARNAIIGITVLQFFDMNVRYPEAFAVSNNDAYGGITFPFRARAEAKAPNNLPPPKAK